MKQTTLIAIVLGILVLISVVQAFQLNGLKEKVAEGQLEVKSASSSTAVASSGTSRKTASLPASVKNLPKMVGGC